MTKIFTSESVEVETLEHIAVLTLWEPITPEGVLARSDEALVTLSLTESEVLEVSQMLARAHYALMAKRIERGERLIPTEAEIIDAHNIAARYPLPD